MRFSVETLATADIGAWAELRAQLWPDHSVEELYRDGLELLAGERDMVFVAKADDELIGFAEASLRVDHVNGTSTSPVTFLEGLYVASHCRRRGIARALCKAVAGWGARNGCTEFASDALVENEEGRDVHTALGFREVERVVYFLKPIDRDAT
ncbi:MAG TPA: aminoglycoside 6'-N-acetyltransferase [Candidatus Baltobacteraceae bacterium]|jgi:aminoglycoside 6'-N-acetyltransferase I|nr:aminoglycoside 6'-N-acetyltransferase [Candidatus Baltobacteraceae bacterium]